MSWCPEVNGIMLDQAGSGEDRLPFYKELADCSRSQGLEFVRANPSTTAAEAYVGVFDNLAIYEGEALPHASQLQEAPTSQRILMKAFLLFYFKERRFARPCIHSRDQGLCRPALHNRRRRKGRRPQPVQLASRLSRGSCWFTRRPACSACPVGLSLSSKCLSEMDRRRSPGWSADSPIRRTRAPWTGCRLKPA